MPGRVPKPQRSVERGLCAQKGRVFAERGLWQRLGCPRMVWVNRQGGEVLEVYWEDEVLHVAQFVGETVTGIVWKGKEDRSPRVGSMQSCWSGGPLPVPTVECWKTKGNRSRWCYRGKGCRITASALKPQRIGRGVGD